MATLRANGVEIARQIGLNGKPRKRLFQTGKVLVPRHGGGFKVSGTMRPNKTFRDVIKAWRTDSTDHVQVLVPDDHLDLGRFPMKQSATHWGRIATPLRMQIAARKLAETTAKREG